MHLIGQAHTLVHQNGVVRVQTDIRAGTRYVPASPRSAHLTPCRTDKKQHFADKVSKVESILAADGKSVEKKVVVTETLRKQDAAAGPEQQPEPQSPAQGSPSTHTGTWASMFRK
jgi:hypothetical protein